jgi:hypothetical protein
MYLVAAHNPEKTISVDNLNAYVATQMDTLSLSPMVSFLVWRQRNIAAMKAMAFTKQIGGDEYGLLCSQNRAFAAR